MPLRPDSSDVFVNTPLTNISIAFQQAPGMHFADQIFPQVPVNRQGDLYWRYDKGDWFRSIAGVRAPATESAGGGWEVSTDSFFCNVYAVHKDVDDQTRANATGAFNMDRDATQWVTKQLLIKRDQLFAATYFTDGVWTGSAAVNGGTSGQDIQGGTATAANTVVQWDLAGSDPVVDIRRQKTAVLEQTGYMPNVLAMSPHVYDALLDNASILDRIRFAAGPSNPAVVGQQTLAALFGVERIVVTRAIQNTAAQGQPEAMSFITGKNAALIYSNPTPSLLQPSAGYIFSWNGLLGGNAFGTRISRMPMPELKADRIEGEMAWDMKVVAPEMGVFFKDIVS